MGNSSTFYGEQLDSLDNIINDVVKIVFCSSIGNIVLWEIYHLIKSKGSCV